jgi:general stress protein 26
MGRTQTPHGTSPSRLPFDAHNPEPPMPTEAEITDKFWKALESDRTLMLGLTGIEEEHEQPMTAMLDDANPGSIWFFTSSETRLVQEMGTQHRAVANFVSKDHELFASIRGELVMENDRTRIDRLWNRFVAAWFPGGKDDPKLRLIRLDPEHAQIWLNESSLLAGIKIMIGRDPKRDYRDKVADVRLDRGTH